MERSAFSKTVTIVKACAWSRTDSGKKMAKEDKMCATISMCGQMIVTSSETPQMKAIKRLGIPQSVKSVLPKCQAEAIRKSSKADDGLNNQRAPKATIVPKYEAKK